MINKNLSGFTLIELMVALAIMGILASVAAGYFGENVKAAKCTEGRSAVLTRATILDKCKAIYGSYTNNCNITLGTTEGGNFDVTLARDAASFTLTATATGGGASSPGNSICTTITLNNLGQKGGTGTAPW